MREEEYEYFDACVASRVKSHGAASANRRHPRFAFGTLVVLVSALLTGAPANAEDCNANGVADSDEIQTIEWTLGRTIGELERNLVLGLGDFDSDGDLDIAGVGTGRALFGRIDGSGRVESLQRLEVDGFLVDPTVADFNGDGHLDLAAGVMPRPSQGGIQVFLNDGAGNFTAPPLQVFDEIQSILTAGDFDGNDTIDVFSVGRFSGVGQVLLNQGNGDFELGQEIQSGGRFHTATAADIDHDGDTDLVTGTAGGTTGAVIYLNDGDAVFSPDERLSAPDFLDSIAVLDFDVDGDLDVAAVAGSVSQLYLWRNDAGSFAEQPPINSTLSGGQLLAADLNEDGYPELAISLTRDNGQLVVFENLAGSALSEPILPAVGYEHATVGDFDGDGLTDLVAMFFSEAVLLRGDAVHTIMVARRYEPPPQIFNGLYDMAVADFDSDGFPDAAVNTFEVSFPVPLTCYRNDGLGRMESSVCSFTSARPRAIDTGDIDGDGDPDLVIARDGGFDFLDNRGSANFRPFQTDLSSNPRDVIVADFDGDGDEDALFSAQLTLVENDGLGISGAPVSFAPGETDLLFTRANFDGNDAADIFVANGPTIRSIAGDSTAKLVERSERQLANPIEALVAADFDADGFDDVAAAAGLELLVAANQGGGTLQEAVAVSTFPFSPPEDLAVGDVDSDGDPDILIGSSAPLRALLNRGDGSFIEVEIPFRLPSQSIETTDVNQDGVVDLMIVPSLGRLALDVILGRLTEGEIADCNVDGILDVCQLGDNDCDANGVPDECDRDGDRDGVVDGCDLCPDADDRIDGDGDLVPDCADACPEDPEKSIPGLCGCGISDSDGDLDGVSDCIDNCPDAANSDQLDSDTDGVGDECDECPTDFNKVRVGQCGCGVIDVDTDFDFVADCIDGCPLDREKQNPGVCGCGVADTDTDLDDLADCIDNCPLDPNPGQADSDADGFGDPCDLVQGPGCFGDCDSDGTLESGEIDAAVGAIFALPSVDCSSRDSDGDGVIRANDIVAMLYSAWQCAPVD